MLNHSLLLISVLCWTYCWPAPCLLCAFFSFPNSLSLPLYDSESKPEMALTAHCCLCLPGFTVPKPAQQSLTRIACIGTDLPPYPWSGMPEWLFKDRLRSLGYFGALCTWRQPVCLLTHPRLSPLSFPLACSSSSRAAASFVSWDSSLCSVLPLISIPYLHWRWSKAKLLVLLHLRVPFFFINLHWRLYCNCNCNVAYLCARMSIWIIATLGFILRLC